MSRKSIKDKIKEARKLRKLTCPFCKEVFMSKINKQEHMKMHRPSRPVAYAAETKANT